MIDNLVDRTPRLLLATALVSELRNHRERRHEAVQTHEQSARHTHICRIMQFQFAAASQSYYRILMNVLHIKLRCMSLMRVTECHILLCSSFARNCQLVLVVASTWAGVSVQRQPSTLKLDRFDRNCQKKAVPR